MPQPAIGHQTAFASRLGREVGDAVAKHIPNTSMEEHGRRDNERVVRLS